MENEELTVCRFCGSDDIEECKGDDSQVTAIFCSKCPAGLEDSTKTLEELREIWNGKIHV